MPTEYRYVPPECSCRPCQDIGGGSRDPLDVILSGAGARRSSGTLIPTLGFAVTLLAHFGVDNGKGYPR